jgi:predicted molibdopterin-dependent oxidoreductase YjgC
MPYSSLQQVRDEIEQLVPLYQGTGYADHEMSSTSLETRRLYGGQFPKGFSRFSQVQYATPRKRPQDGYPFTLLVGTILYQFGSGSRSSRASRLKKFQPEAFVEISESDAKRLGIIHGDKVTVISPLSQVTATARITDTVVEGMLFIPMSFPESPVNALFDIALDPRSKTPSLKACAVSLERIGSHG